MRRTWSISRVREAQVKKKIVETARGRAREDKPNRDKVIGLKQREKWSLRSSELKDVIDNLEANKKVVAVFKAAGASQDVYDAYTDCRRGCS